MGSHAACPSDPTGCPRHWLNHGVVRVHHEKRGSTSTQPEPEQRMADDLPGGDPTEWIIVERKVVECEEFWLREPGQGFSDTFVQVLEARVGQVRKGEIDGRRASIQLPLYKPGLAQAAWPDDEGEQRFP